MISTFDSLYAITYPLYKACDDGEIHLYATTTPTIPSLSLADQSPTIKVAVVSMLAMDMCQVSPPGATSAMEGSQGMPAASRLSFGNCWPCV